MQRFMPVEKGIYEEALPVQQGFYQQGKVDVKAIDALYGRIDNYLKSEGVLK